jgi:hypothetical protein
MPDMIQCEVPDCSTMVDLDDGNGAFCPRHQDWERCGACGDWFERGDGCRHMRESVYGEALGAGLWYDDRSVERCVRAVLVTVGEVWALRLRDALETRHYLSCHAGVLLGDCWLNFHLGGRWSDGQGGGQCRSPDAGPDVDDPQAGWLLVGFPVPGEPPPSPPTRGLGELLTRIAHHHADLDVDQDDWQDGVGWLVSMSARDDCRDAEHLTCAIIGRWLAEITGFEEVPHA